MDITHPKQGEVNGRLTYTGQLRIVKNSKGYNVYEYEAMCSCGKVYFIPRSGWTYQKTAGCLDCHNRDLAVQRKLPLRRSRLYRIFHNILQRCENPRNTGYRQYGHKGISVCPEWHNFDNFAAWALANGYTDDLTIDRIDTRGNYCAENCQWISMKDNLKKRTKTRILSYPHGEVFLGSEEAARVLGYCSSHIRKCCRTGTIIKDRWLYYDIKPLLTTTSRSAYE